MKLLPWASLGLASLLLGATLSAHADVRIGALYPFSGGLALLGDESFRGAEIAVAERNAAGGLKGEPITLIKSDAVDAGQAVGAARQLTSGENVTAVLGSYSSALSFAATQVTEVAGVPYFELGAVSDDITDRGLKYVFRSNPTAKSFAKGTITAVTEIVAPQLGVDPKSLKIAIIHEDALYGTTVAKYQKQFAAEQGLNIVETLPYSAKAVGAQNIEGVLDVDFPQFQTNEAGAPGIAAFAEAYRKRYGMEPRSGHSLINYVGAKIFLDAMQNAKSLDADDIRAAVAKVDIPVGQTAAGIGAQFAENGQNQRAETTVMQWQGGVLKTVYPQSAAVAKAQLAKQP